jgi:hypothetical protein
VPEVSVSIPTDQDRLKMKSILLEYLLKRSSAQDDPSQSEFLTSTLIPEIEESLFQRASSAERYSDMSTLKSRLKVIFGERIKSQQVDTLSSQSSDMSSTTPNSNATIKRSFPSTPATNIQMLSPDAPDSRTLTSPALDDHVRIKPPPADILIEKPRWGNAPHPLKSALPIRHYPSSGAFGGVLVKLVLETRTEQPPNLPNLNKWQHRGCAQCNCEITTGSFGVKANYCHYTELLYCPACIGGEEGKGQLRAIPWRVVQNLDNARYIVSKPAADFLDEVWDMPLVSLSRVAPRTIAGSLQLQRIAALRAILTTLREKIVRSAVANTTISTSTLSSVSSLPMTISSNDIKDTECVPISELTLTLPAARASLAKVIAVLRKTLGISLAFLGEEDDLLPISLVCLCASQRGADAILRKLELAKEQLLVLSGGQDEVTKSQKRNSRGGIIRKGSNSVSSPKLHRGSRKSVNPSYDRGAHLDDFESEEDEDDEDEN